MAKKVYKVRRVNSLPSSGVNGDQYLLRKPDNRYELYTVAPDGSFVFLKGVTDAQWSRVERLNNEQVTKLEDLDTQSEIDDKIVTATSNASANLIPVSGTVLPRGTDIPDYITNAGKAELLGKEGGTTYTNTGKPSPDNEFTVPEGYIGYTYYDKATDTWSLIDMGELPQASGVDVITPSGKDLVNEEAVRKYSATETDVLDSTTVAVPVAYGGLLDYRYYNLDNSEDGYETVSSDISQSEDEVSNTVSVLGTSGDIENTVYLQTGKEITSEKLLFEGAINSSSDFFGIGLGYNVGGSFRGVMYASNGTVVRSVPRTRIIIPGGEDLPILEQGDYVKIEIDIQGPTSQIWTFYKNNIPVYKGDIGVNITLGPDSEWILSLKGYDVSVTYNKIATREDKFTTPQDIQDYDFASQDDLQGFATQAELTDALTAKTEWEYDGALPYRFYDDTNADSDYTEEAGEISQQDNGDSNILSITGADHVDDMVYFDIDKFIEVSQEKTVVFEAIINSADFFFGVGLAYEANNAVRGVLYTSNTNTGVGSVVRSAPRSRIQVDTTIPTITVGDLVRIEVDMRSSADQAWRFYKNGSLVYEGGINANVPIPPDFDSKWWLCLKGTDIEVTVNKVSELSNRFPSYEEVENMLHPLQPVLQGFKVLPDRPSGAPSGGFTCTGLDRITRGDYAGCWIAASDGRTIERDGSTYVPEAIIMDADFNRILKVIVMPYTGASLQGVAVDTSGQEDTFWVATAGNRTIRHFDFDGVEIQADRFDWGVAYPTLGNPNGLAYDPENDAVWCSDVAGNFRLISCDSSIPDREVNSLSISGDEPDMLQYKNDRIYFSRGANGFNGSVRYITVSTGIVTQQYESLFRAQAIEGIYIDDVENVLYILNDGGFHHVANPALNIVLRYSI